MPGKKKAEEILPKEAVNEIRETAVQNPGEDAEKKEDKKTRNALLAEKAAAAADRERKNTERQKLLTEDSAVRSAIKNGRLIHATVISTDKIYTEEKILTVAYAVTEGEVKTKVTVPYEEMYNRNLIDMSTVDTSTPKGRGELAGRQEQMLLKMVGLRTSVCITDIVDDPRKGYDIPLVIASRKAACEAIRRYAFIDNNKYKNGGMYQATVMSVGSKSLAVSFSGVDKVINLYSLTDRYITDLNSHYKVGDKIDFIAENITVENGSVDLEFNTKGAELRHALENSKLVYVGETGKATISRIYRTKAGKLNITAWMDYYDMAVIIPEVDASCIGIEMTSGTDILVRVNGKYPSGYLSGSIRSVLNSESLFKHL